ncbi:MAG TPA: hypothetical protein VKN99_18815 [Polyangia bacterium]|nr:hypothetical protein [Polyangia bacterium]
MRLPGAAFAVCLLLACGPPPPPRTGPPPPRFHDSARGLSFDPPAPPFLRSETDAQSSIAHFADPITRAGIHLLAFAASGPTDAAVVQERAQSYLRGLEDSVAGLVVDAVRTLDRFGLRGVEIEYDGGASPRMHTIDWVLYAPGVVYVVKVTAPTLEFAELSAPLLRARASLRIEPVK